MSRTGQTYAFRKGPISELGGLELADKDKLLVRSNGVPWWKELWTPTVTKVLESLPSYAYSGEVEAKTLDCIVESVGKVLEAECVSVFCY